MALAEFRALVTDKLRDTAGLVTDAQRDTAIGEAVKDYSRWRPYVVKHEITGDGTVYSFSLPATFEAGWSSLLEVEHPVNEQPRSYLDASDFTLYTSVAGVRAIEFTDLVIEAAANAYVAFTARHTVNATTATIPDADQEIVASKAAAICLRQLAAYYAQTSDPSLGADAVNYRSKAQEYLALAKALDAQYDLAIGISKEAATVAASAVGDLDVEMQDAGGPRFFHGNTFR